MPSIFGSQNETKKNYFHVRVYVFKTTPALTAYMWNHKTEKSMVHFKDHV